MALRIKLPPATRPPIRFEPIMKAEIPAELLRRGTNSPIPMVTIATAPTSAPASALASALTPASTPTPIAASSPQPLPQVVPTVVKAPVQSVPLSARTIFAARASAAPFPAPAPLGAIASLPVAASVETIPAAEAAKPEEPPVSEAILKPSSAPAMIRAFSLVFKWGGLAAVLCGIGFLALKFLVPFLDELRNPGRTDAITNKEAPTAVRVLQQTRQVVAKNDAKVDYLNNVVAALDGNAVAPKAAPAPVAPVVQATPAAAPKAAGSQVVSNLGPFQDAVARLTVGGVFDGPEPRAYLDGRLVKYGEIIDRNLGLRFVGVDPNQHAVLFTNADNVTFRKHF